MRCQIDASYRGRFRASTELFRLKFDSGSASRCWSRGKERNEDLILLQIVGEPSASVSGIKSGT